MTAIETCALCEIITQHKRIHEWGGGGGGGGGRAKHRMHLTIRCYGMLYARLCTTDTIHEVHYMTLNIIKGKHNSIIITHIKH